MKNMMTRKTPGLKARGRAARLAVFAFAVFAAGSSLGARTVRLSETGDLHLPETVTADTPCQLLIHGGGWAAMSRRDVVGIADYFAKDLGFVVYNVDYRLASPEHPWPACGEDCVADASEAGGRTAVRLDLPRGGSAFVVFADKPARPQGTGRQPLDAAPDALLRAVCLRPAPAVRPPRPRPAHGLRQAIDRSGHLAKANINSDNTNISKPQQTRKEKTWCAKRSSAELTE